MIMTQLQRISDGVVFTVGGTKIHGRGQLNPDGSGAKHPDGDCLWLINGPGPYKGKAFGIGGKYLRDNFAAYPPQPQPQPDRVDRLMQETDGWEPLQAYRATFCPADDRRLETGHRVVEAYAGALVDASKCPACGLFFADDTLTEIKLWKD
jgi:hypothetical protein